jgi:hypothetical protein
MTIKANREREREREGERERGEREREREGERERREREKRMQINDLIMSYEIGMANFGLHAKSQYSCRLTLSVFF